MPTKSKSSITTSESAEQRPPATRHARRNAHRGVHEASWPFGECARSSLALHVPATRIQAIVNGECAITAETALRLGRYFGNSAEFWLNLQKDYELDVATRANLSKIEAEIQTRYVGFGSGSKTPAGVRQPSRIRTS